MCSTAPAFPEMAPHLSVFLPSRGQSVHESQTHERRLSTGASSLNSISLGRTTSDDTDSASVTDSDQLAVSNAVIGLIAASAQTYKDLDELNATSNFETKFLPNALSVLKSFKITIQIVYKFLRRLEIGTLERKDRPSLIGVDIIIVILSEAAFAISDLGNLLLHAVKQANQRSTIAKALQERSAGIEKETKKIAMAEVLMTKLISVLRVDSEPEARRHLSQTEIGIHEVLQRNAALAQRIRQVTDIFGARALVPSERLAAIVAGGPPAYSVPTSLAEELPDYSAAVSNGVNADGSITIRPTAWSVFSGLTLGDASILSLIPLPIRSNELRYGTRFYTFEYSRRVNEQLGELAEKNTRSKTEALTQILDLRKTALWQK